MKVGDNRAVLLFIDHKMRQRVQEFADEWQVSHFIGITPDSHALEGCSLDELNAAGCDVVLRIDPRQKRIAHRKGYFNA